MLGIIVVAIGLHRVAKTLQHSKHLIAVFQTFLQLLTFLERIMVSLPLVYRFEFFAKLDNSVPLHCQRALDRFYSDRLVSCRNQVATVGSTNLTQF